MSAIQPYGRIFVVALWVIVIVESLSLLVHTFPELHTAVFIAVTVAVLGISLWRLHYGLYAVLAELFIGSFGYLFFWDIDEFRFSIRLALFLALLLGWVVHIIRRKHVIFFRTPFVWPLALFLLALVVGVVLGINAGNATKDVFLDVNGYLYYGLIGVIFSTIVSWKRISDVLQVLFAAVTTMAIKTFAMVFYFAHQTDDLLLRTIYTWVRDTRVGEISIVVDNYYRIFFQGHFWSLVVLVISIVMLLLSTNESKRTNRMYWVMTLLSSTTLIISFSRSIWLGLVVTLSLIGLWALIKKIVTYKQSFKIVGVSILIIVFELLFISFLVNVPLSGSGGNSFSAGSLVKERITTTDEPAVGSRFQLIRPLAEKALEKPIFGSGFATTVSYQSLDPRTRDLNGGVYTTYSFEWGYLEIMVKVGVVGLLLYLLFIWRVVRLGMHASARQVSLEKKALLYGLLFAVAGLLTIHFTTPYLNHPLGITLIMLSAAIFYLAYNEKGKVSH